MTLTQFVRSECANYMPDGSCMGMPLIPKKGVRIFPADRCRAIKGTRCTYFEDYVLPLAASRGLEKVVEQYRDIPGTLSVRTAQTRYCECGHPLRKRERFCDACKAKRRREAYRTINQRRATSNYHT